MKGLLKNSFYGAMGGAKLTVAFFVALGAAVLISANDRLFLIFGLLCATVFALNALDFAHKEAATNWAKYVIAAPIRRRDIVKSRYVGHVLWVLAGTIFATIFIGLTLLVRGNRFFSDALRDPVSMFCVSVGTSILLGGLYYPLVQALGADKGEIVMVISLLGAIGITAGYIWLVNLIFGAEGITDAEFFLSLAAYMIIAASLFVLSYYVTASIYERMEY